MKTIKEHQNVLIKYWREYYIDGGFDNLFKLRLEMIEKGICPRCGTHSRCWSSRTGHFPCDECGFNMTQKEIQMLYDDKKGILRRKLKMKPPKGFVPFSVVLKEPSQKETKEKE